jgi:hypothetical protein
MKNMKNKLVEWLIVLVVAFAAVFFVVTKTIKGSNVQVALQLDRQSEKLEQISNDVIMNQQSILMVNDLIVDMDTNQAKYLNAIKENTRWQQINYQQMLKLKTLYDEKINSVSNYNYNQVDSFFANRYDSYKKD